MPKITRDPSPTSLDRRRPCLGKSQVFSSSALPSSMTFAKDSAGHPDLWRPAGAGARSHGSANNDLHGREIVLAGRLRYGCNNSCKRNLFGQRAQESRAAPRIILRRGGLDSSSKTPLMNHYRY